jgi:protein phosphatase PTC2/3
VSAYDGDDDGAGARAAPGGGAGASASRRRQRRRQTREAAAAARRQRAQAAVRSSPHHGHVRAARLYIAHVGDCRAVLSHRGHAVDLTLDHKPSTRPDEVARIAAAGGWTHNGRLHGVLAVSRAFGDAEHKNLKERFWECNFKADPLIAEPDIRIHTIRPRDEFVVLACDGVYDVMSSQMVVNFVRRKLRAHRDVQRAAEQLVAKAISLSSVDNCSAFVVAFHQGGVGGGGGGAFVGAAGPAGRAAVAAAAAPKA